MNHSKKLCSNTKQVVAFMSIKPPYALKLVDGDKEFEFRKIMPRQKVSHIVIYATSPMKRIIGVAEVDSIDVASPETTWENTKHSAGISYEAYMEYFKNVQQAVAIKIKNVIRLSNFVEPERIRKGFKVPQSFLYTDYDFMEGVLRSGMKT